jgi:membrane protein involved in colicin uptake
MPIDLSKLSAEDVAAATAAVEAARRAREERECQAAEEQQKQQEEEQARQEATMQREAEERKEAAAWKAEAERRDRSAREKAAQEQWQSLATGLSGLKLTIPAPASIARMTLGSSTQSKGKRKATEEEPSTSQYVSLFMFHSPLTFL